MSRKVLCASLSLLLVVVAFSAFAVAGTVSYSETFQTTGEQATADGSSFTNYTNWTYYTTDNANAGASVGTAGILTLGRTAIADDAGTVLASISAQALAGQSAFDVSTNALTVSADMTGTGPAGMFHVSLLVGAVEFMFHPGHNKGAGRVKSLRSGAIIDEAPDLGFTPSQNNLYNVSVTIVENSGDSSQYDVSYSMGSFSKEFTAGKADFGSLDSVGLMVNGTTGSSEYGKFSNITVSQLPEPAATVIMGTGIAGLL